MRLGIPAAIIVGILLILVIVNQGDDDTDVATVADTASVVDTVATTVASTAADTTGAEPTSAEPAEGCPPEDGVDTPVTEFSAPQPFCIDENSLYEATFDTSAGEIVIELDPTLDPASVNNFVVLARYRYYEGSTFHRVINDFVIQGGIPDGGSQQSPGYSFTGAIPDSVEGQNVYQVGDFAMANRADPTSNGGQWFIVTGDSGASLPALYSLMGRVTEGLDIALAIQEVETAAGDVPVDDVIINSVTVSQVSA